MHMCMYAHQRVMIHKTREGRMYKPHRNPPNLKTNTCPHDTNPKEAARQFNISTTWVTSCGRNGCCWCTTSTYKEKPYGITAPSPLWRISTNCCTNCYKLLHKPHTPLLRFVQIAAQTGTNCCTNCTPLCYGLLHAVNGIFKIE